MAGMYEFVRGAGFCLLPGQRLGLLREVAGTEILSSIVDKV
jgi:hypothetical protein